MSDLASHLARKRHAVLARQCRIHPEAVGIKMFERQQIQPALIDPSVIEGEQKTIDFYLRAGLLKKHLDAKDVLDPVFNGAAAAALEL